MNLQMTVTQAANKESWLKLKHFQKYLETFNQITK